MSALDDKIAELQADATSVKSTVDGIRAQVADLQSQLAAAQAAGQAPTQAQLDALESVHAQLAAIAAPAPAAAPAVPAAPAAPTA